MKKTYLPGFAIPASRIARMFNRAFKPQRIISTPCRPVNMVLLLLLAALPLAAQNTATSSGDFDKCATWGNPTTLFQNITDTKTINTGVTVNAVTTGWSTKEIVLNGTGAVDLSGTSYVSFDTDNGADKSCAFVCGSSITTTYNGSSITYGTVVSPTGKCWLDRNLGASRVATSSTDAAAIGGYYQWGRLDDGHQTSTPPGTTTTLSTTDVPGHNKFIVSSGDWRNPKNDNLWQGVSGINNPCPAGFRVPTEAEWTTEFATWTSGGGMASVLKMPYTGQKNGNGSGTASNTNIGYIWFSTIDGDRSMTVRYDAEALFMSTFNAGRAAARPVRCIKD